MSEENAVSTPQQPVDAPVTGNADAQAVPSGDAKPDLIDFSPLGETWKDIKVNKAIAEKLPSFLKSEHLTPELVELLNDPMEAKLFFTDNKGYRRVQNEKYETISKKGQEISAKEKTLLEKEKTLTDRERELADIEGDNYFYRNDKVKRVAREAAKEAEEMGLEGERVTAYVDKIVKPYLEVAKSEHLKQKESEKQQVDAFMKQVSAVGVETFPEFPPTIAAQLIDGFIEIGSDPKSAAQLLRSELDRIIESSNARAVADYVKKLNQKQPDIPVIEQSKMIPNNPGNTTKDEEVNLGNAILGFFGKK